MMILFRLFWPTWLVMSAVHGSHQNAKKPDLKKNFDSPPSSTVGNIAVANGSSFRVTTNPESFNKLANATVMVCSIVKNEESYIDEWLTYHKFLGFDRVHLYDNADNASDYLAGLPDRYGDYVSVTHLPGLGKQPEAYSDCTRQGAKRNLWAAFIDIDEFIVLRKHSNIKAFLHDVAPVGGSVVLNWSIMGSNGTMHYSPAPVVARFTLTSVAPNQHIKTIAYLPHVLRPNIHNCYMKPGHPSVDQHGRPVDPSSPFHFGNDREIAHINHYYTKSWEEFKLKRRRGFASNYKKNHLFEDESDLTLKRIANDYIHANNATNAVQDLFARNFYLRRLFRINSH